MSAIQVSKIHAQKLQAANRKPGARPAVQDKPHRLHTVEKSTAILPASMNPSALGSSTQNDIPIPQSLLGNLLGMTLSFTCTNNTGSTITFPTWGAIDMISSIEQLFDGGRTPLVKHIKETLLFSMRYLSPDEIVTYKRGFMPPSGGTLAANASFTFYLPLLNDPLVLNNILMMGFNEQVVYRIWFQPTAWPGVVPTMSNFQMIARHSMSIGNHLGEMRNMYANNSLHFPYHKYQEQNERAQVITASSTVKFNLTQFKGIISDIMVYVRVSGSIIITDLSQLIDSFSLIDANDIPILGLANCDVNYYNSVLCASHKIRSVVNPAAADPWLSLNLSSDVKTDYQTGSVSGYYLFTGNEKLVLKFKSTIATDTYVITAVQGIRKEFDLNNGELELLK